MAISKDELQQIDNQASTKQDLEQALKDHQSDHPGLEDVDAENQTREEMLETAEGAIEEGLSAEGKRRSLKNLLESQPDSVLHLSGQAFLRLEHPRREDENFVMNVFNDMGMKQVGSPQDPETDDHLAEDADVGQLDVNFTSLEDVPEWALPQVYDLILGGTIDVYENTYTAQEEAETQVTGPEQPILDEPSTPIRMHTYRDEEAGGFGEDDAPLVTEPDGEFNRPEQRAAWRVLAKTVDGEDPLPGNPDEVSADPNNITEAEKRVVEGRIKKCLQSPHRFDENADPVTFDKRVFFDQLLQCEVDGMTAARHQEQKVSGVTRPAVVKIIRRIADEHGFDVVGTYVQEKPDTGLEEDLPGTVPMTPESERKHGHNERPDPTREY